MLVQSFQDLKGAFYIMFEELKKYIVKPPLYTPSTNSLWDDEHVSKNMLKAHLNPDLEAATRKHDFIDKSVKWITEITPPIQYKTLLDLGCGPGLYAEQFSDAMIMEHYQLRTG